MRRLAVSSVTSASEEHRRLVVAHYERQLKKHGPTARGMDWKDSDSQRLRFEVLTEGLDLAGSTVHEVGAGAGHFYDFLLDRVGEVVYSGSDLSAEMIEAAKQRHPRANFEQRDVLDEAVAERYDFVFCSGLFHVSLGCPDSDWQQFVEAAVSRMYEMCNVAIGFNMMSDRVDYRSDGLYYSDPDEMRLFCHQRFGAEVGLRQDYPLYEYTVHVSKQASRS